MNNHEETLQSVVMNKIHAGGVHMRPRWQFVFISALYLLGALITLLAILYLASLSVFLLRDSGVWFAPTFGARGWFALAHSLPVYMILFVVLFVLLLQFLVRRYAFVYKRPLLASLATIVLVVLVGGFFISQTSLHHDIAQYARGVGAPPPLGALYGRPPHPDGFFPGTIVATSSTGFVIKDPDGDRTLTVMIDRHTQLPDADDFQVGSRVLVIGDQMASDTIKAFGVKGIDQ